MACEKCKICRQWATPWEYYKPLDGHICCDCSYLIGYVENRYEDFFLGLKNAEDSSYLSFSDREIVDVMILLAKEHKKRIIEIRKQLGKL